MFHDLSSLVYITANTTESLSPSSPAVERAENMESAHGGPDTFNSDCLRPVL
jgi:hypothetical protein